MSDLLKASLVRIFLPGNTHVPVGVGFLVTDKHVLTCAHVITDTLRLRDPSSMPQDEIGLDFPFIAPGRMLTAQVIGWQPKDDDDIAVLELETLPPPTTRPVRLTTAQDLWGHSFRAFGFPLDYDKGVWASGVMRDRHAGGWVQIEAITVPGHRVVEGFSGTPVWDEQLDGVAGMVVESDKQDGVKAAYIIPTDFLIKAWPNLSYQAIPPCPYRGLFAFRENDEAYFFGRETYVGHLVETVHKKLFVTVVGPSGSGKSSVVFAGLVPRLRHMGNWLITSFRPGNHPFLALATALIPLLETNMSETDRLLEIKKLGEQFQNNRLALLEVIERILQKHSETHLLLVADQFEELYTFSSSPEDREYFLDFLLAADPTTIRQHALNYHVAITLRADFFSYALSYRPFADALQDADVKLGPMTRSELQDAITKPAEKLGVHVDDGVVERIAGTVSKEPGSLPLLEFALTLLWKRQRNGRLTLAAYDDIGGVEQALAAYADEIYGGLAQEEQRQVQQIFIQLVRPGEGTEDTRRVATRAEIGEERWKLIPLLCDARLVVSSYDDLANHETVEVVHEALIRGWKRLRVWMENHREFRMWQERLRVALQQWKVTDQDDDALLRGTLLGEATKWMAVHADAMSQQEQAFIRTSQYHQEQAAQQWKALYEEAERQRRVALARGLVVQSELLHTRYPHLLERSMLLAVEALHRLHSIETDQALRQCLALLRPRLGVLQHQGTVTDVCFSAFGHFIATSSEDQTACVWDVLTGKRLVSFSHHKPVAAIAFSPDERFLATACADQTAALWDIATGRCLARYPHHGAVWTVAFSPNGRLLATGGADTTARLWDVSSGRCLTTFSHQKTVTDVIFSPNGRFIATASVGNVTTLWDISSRYKLSEFPHKGAVRALAFSPDGHTLAIGGADSLVTIRDVATGELLMVLRLKGTVWAMAYSPDGHTLATTSVDNIATLWNLTTGERFASLPHTDTVWAVAFSPNGSYLATASDDKTAALWDVSLDYRHASIVHHAAIWMVTFSPDSNILATASDDKTAALWDVSSGQRLASFPHENRVIAATFSPDGHVLATTNISHQVKLWNTTTGEVLASLSHSDTVWHVTFSPDGQFIATACANQAAMLWDVHSGQHLMSFPHQNVVWMVAFCPEGHTLASCSVDGTAVLWDLSDHRVKASLGHRGPVRAVAFSPDGYLTATASDDKTAALWRTTSGKKIQDLPHAGPVYSAMFSPDGRYLATTCDDNTTALWDVATGECLVTLPHQDFVNAVTFNGDGRYLATASADGTAAVWSVPDGNQLARLHHEESVRSVAFSSNGKYLATSSNECIAHLWFIEPEDLIAQAHACLTRNLTMNEWKQYLGNEPYRKTCPHLP